MNQSTRLKPLFHPGRLCITPAAHTALRGHGIPVISVVLQHVCGNWGDLPDDDRHQNDLSVETGLRVLSSYRLSDALRIWVITEWDRSVTTILLPDEY